MNNWITKSVVYGQSFLLTVVSALKTVPGGALVVAGKLRLSKDPAFNPTSASTISALAANEADYSGYASGGIAVVLTTGLLVGTVGVGAEAPAVFVAATATPFVPATVYGYWVDDGTNVIAAEAFGGGQSALFGAVGDFLALTLLLPFRFQQGAA